MVFLVFDFCHNVLKFVDCFLFLVLRRITRMTTPTTIKTSMITTATTYTMILKDEITGSTVFIGVASSDIDVWRERKNTNTRHKM